MCGVPGSAAVKHVSAATSRDAASHVTVAGVLTIDSAILHAIIAHARRDHPDEACGVIAGPAGSDRPERFIPMLNAARSPTFYEFDSGDLLLAAMILLTFGRRDRRPTRRRASPARR